MLYLIMFLSGLTLLQSFSLDEPIIMERIVHRVDWDEVLLEYDPSVAPNRNMTIEVNATLISYSYEMTPKRVARGIYDIDISWEDQRLRISPGVKVSIPSTVKIWKPNIIVQNAVAEEMLRTTGSYSKGKFRLHQRRNIHLAEKLGAKQSKPIFQSFEDGSSDSTTLQSNIQGEVPNSGSTEGWIFI